MYEIEFKKDHLDTKRLMDMKEKKFKEVND